MKDEPIWPRGNVWYALFYYNGEDGVRRKFYKSTGIDIEKKREALRIARKWMKEANQTGTVDGILPSRKPKTEPTNQLPLFKDFARVWYVEHAQEEIEIEAPWKTATKVGYESVMRNHIDEDLGNFRLDEITPRMIQRFVTDKLGKGYQPHYVNNMLGVISSVFGYAEDEYEDLNLKNPVRRKHWRKPVPKKRRSAYTDEQIQKFLATCKLIEQTLFHFVLLLFTTGMRWCEITALRWGDVDFDAGVIHLARAQYRGYEGKPKNGEPRDVHLHPNVVAVLLAYRPSKWQKDDLLYPSNRKMRRPLKKGEKKFLRTYEIRDAYRRVQEAAGLPKINFQEARHSFNSWLLNSNKSPYVAKELLGHKTMQMTIGQYGHPEQKALHKEVASLRIECLEEPEMPDPVGNA